MATFTVSGAATYPDNATPMRGKWIIGIYTTSGVVFDGDGSWRGGHQAWQTAADGSLTITLPETNEFYYYTAMFDPKDRGQATIGPFPFELDRNKTWTDIIETPLVGDPPPGGGYGGGGGWTEADASVTTKGILKLSTQALGDAATDNSTAMTPVRVRTAVKAYLLALGWRPSIPINSDGSWPVRATYLTSIGGWTGPVIWDSLLVPGATAPPEQGELDDWYERVSA